MSTDLLHYTFLTGALHEHITSILETWSAKEIGILRMVSPHLYNSTSLLNMNRKQFTLDDLKNSFWQSIDIFKSCVSMYCSLKGIDCQLLSFLDECTNDAILHNMFEHYKFLSEINFPHKTRQNDSNLKMIIKYHGEKFCEYECRRIKEEGREKIVSIDILINAIYTRNEKMFKYVWDVYDFFDCTLESFIKHIVDINWPHLLKHVISRFGDQLRSYDYLLEREYASIEFIEEWHKYLEISEQTKNKLLAKYIQSPALIAIILQSRQMIIPSSPLPSLLV